MDATVDYSARPPVARKPLSERVNVRLIVFLLIAALPFAWCLWLIVDNRMIVNEGDYYAVDLKGMGNFPFDARRDSVEAIPKEVRDLNGKKVRFEGEMYAPDQASDGVRDFQLVYSIVECCLGGPPKVQERVFAHVPDTIRLPNYTGRQVNVVGTLHIEVKREGGEAVSVFTMDVDEVTPRT
jgi:hypothetical protein